MNIQGVPECAVYKLGGEVENILKSHNYVGKHGWKRNPDEIKRHKTGQTLNSDIYSRQLDLLKLVTEQKWPELANRRGVLFHQDNPTLHTLVVNRQKLWELGWKVLMHPPYSSDLAPNDYHLFSHCKTSKVIRN
ncbi:putative DD34D transposase [Trichonephila clavipes]|nr:putative DD34D transposase [Trichonephila clavipes]